MGDPVVAPPRVSRHLALPYLGRGDFLAAALPFLLGDGGSDTVRVAVLGPRSLPWLREALAGQALAGEALAGQALAGEALAVRLVPADRWYLTPSRTLAAYDEVVADAGGREVRIIGEPVWAGRCPVFVREWHRYESIINVAFAEPTVQVLCPYDVRSVDPRIVATARRTHPMLAAGGVSWPSTSYTDPVSFYAECNQEPLPPPAASARTLVVREGGLAELRSWVMAGARAAGLRPERAHDLVISVNELATNVLRHTSATGGARLWVAGDELLCDVVDDAGLLRDDFLGHLPPRIDPVEPPESGAGLWLCRQLCDLVEMRTAAGRSTVRLHMALHRL